MSNDDKNFLKEIDDAIEIVQSDLKIFEKMDKAELLEKDRKVYNKIMAFIGKMDQRIALFKRLRVCVLTGEKYDFQREERW